MATYRMTTSSPRPPEEVFSYMARFSNAAVWDPGVAAAEEVGPSEPALGTVYRLTVRAFGRPVPLDYRITQFDAPRRVVLSAENATVRSVDAIDVAPGTEGGSVVTYEANLTLKGLAALLTPMLGLSFKRIGDRAAVSLRRVLST